MNADPNFDLPCQQKILKLLRNIWNDMCFRKEKMRINPAHTNKAFFSLQPRFSRIVVAVGVAVLFSTANPARAAGRQLLQGHVPEAAFHLQALGHLPATNRLSLAIGLPLRNETELDSLLRQIYDPGSPNFRQYLTPEQFTERFGPTEQDYQAVINFANANGLTVTGTHPDRAVLEVSGPVADIERALHVTLQTYRHPREARNFYAPDVEPSLDLAVPILQISGLNNYSLPHPNLKVRPLTHTSAMTPNYGSGPNNTYLGSDFRAAYVPDVTLAGSGQNVALVEFDGYVSNDIAAYIEMAGLTNPVSIINVPVDGGIATPGPFNSEVCLDIEMVLAMSPGVSNIYVYEAPMSTSWATMLSAITNSVQTKQIACSWSGGGPDATADGIFKKMAVLGQSYFNASGDNDAYTSSMPFPSDSTNITVVGGTELTTTGPGGSYISETVWNERIANLSGGDWGSSGGISPTYAIPTWQQGVITVANQGSLTKRNLPDVALTAQNVFIIADTNQQEVVGGTSCAAPLWAGFTALVNQQAAKAGKPSVGFINPAIYAIGRSPAYPTYFHDVTTGDNTWSGSPTKFYATSGYDLCTGWGSPNGLSLINALANATDFTPPTNQITAPTPGLLVSNGLYTVTGKARDDVAVSNVLYQLNNGGWNPATTTNQWTNWSVQVPLIQGSNTVQACAVDTTGNVSPTNKVIFDYLVSAILTVTTNGLGGLQPER